MFVLGSVYRYRYGVQPWQSSGDWGIFIPLSSQRNSRTMISSESKNFYWIGRNVGCATPSIWIMSAACFRLLVHARVKFVWPDLLYHQLNSPVAANIADREKHPFFVCQIYFCHLCPKEHGRTWMWLGFWAFSHTAFAKPQYSTSTFSGTWLRWTWQVVSERRLSRVGLDWCLLCRSFKTFMVYIGVLLR